LTSDFWVSAYLRQAALDGLVAVLRRRGAHEAGAIFVKLDRTCRRARRGSGRDRRGFGRGGLLGPGRLFEAKLGRTRRRRHRRRHGGDRGRMAHFLEDQRIHGDEGGDAGEEEEHEAPAGAAKRRLPELAEHGRLAACRLAAPDRRRGQGRVGMSAGCKRCGHGYGLSVKQSDEKGSWFQDRGAAHGRRSRS
ncbi:DUF1491 family protein, partial [Bosea caraganae]